jgi:hypothetical protein
MATAQQPQQGEWGDVSPKYFILTVVYAPQVPKVVMPLAR